MPRCIWIDCPLSGMLAKLHVSLSFMVFPTLQYFIILIYDWKYTYCFHPELLSSTVCWWELVMMAFGKNVGSLITNVFTVVLRVVPSFEYSWELGDTVRVTKHSMIILLQNFCLLRPLNFSSSKLCFVISRTKAEFHTWHQWVQVSVSLCSKQLQCLLVLQSSASNAEEPY